MLCIKNIKLPKKTALLGKYERGYQDRVVSLRVNRGPHGPTDFGQTPL